MENEVRNQAGQCCSLYDPNLGVHWVGVERVQAAVLTRPVEGCLRVTQLERGKGTLQDVFGKRVAVNECLDDLNSPCIYRYTPPPCRCYRSVYGCLGHVMPDAIEKLLDVVLASPQLAVRMGV
jgi:hypothetical protein